MNNFQSDNVTEEFNKVQSDIAQLFGALCQEDNWFPLKDPDKLSSEQAYEAMQKVNNIHLDSIENFDTYVNNCRSNNLFMNLLKMNNADVAMTIKNHYLEKLIKNTEQLNKKDLEKIYKENVELETELVLGDNAVVESTVNNIMQQTQSHIESTTQNVKNNGKCAGIAVLHEMCLNHGDKLMKNLQQYSKNLNAFNLNNPSSPLKEKNASVMHIIEDIANVNTLYDNLFQPEDNPNNNATKLLDALYDLYFEHYPVRDNENTKQTPNIYKLLPFLEEVFLINIELEGPSQQAKSYTQSKRNNIFSISPYPTITVALIPEPKEHCTLTISEEFENHKRTFVEPPIEDLMLRNNITYHLNDINANPNANIHNLNLLQKKEVDHHADRIPQILKENGNILDHENKLNNAQAVNQEHRRGVMENVNINANPNTNTTDLHHLQAVNQEHQVGVMERIGNVLRSAATNVGSFFSSCWESLVSCCKNTSNIENENELQIERASNNQQPTNNQGRNY